MSLSLFPPPEASESAADACLWCVRGASGALVSAHLVSKVIMLSDAKIGSVFHVGHILNAGLTIIVAGRP